MFADVGGKMFRVCLASNNKYTWKRDRDHFVSLGGSPSNHKGKLWTEPLVLKSEGQSDVGTNKKWHGRSYRRALIEEIIIRIKIRAKYCTMETTWHSLSLETPKCHYPVESLYLQIVHSRPLFLYYATVRTYYIYEPYSMMCSTLRSKDFPQPSSL